MDLDWAEQQCDLLMKRVANAKQALTTVTSGGRTDHRESAIAALNEQVEVVRHIAERVAPDALSVFAAVRDVRDWSQVAGRVKGAIRSQRDFVDQLGPRGPSLAARAMHKKVWSVASAYWDTQMFDDAIEAAAKIVRAEARAKSGKLDLDESAVGDLFSTSKPTPSMPRLRFPDFAQDDKKTWKAMHLGALHFTKGAFLALRNPRSHHIMASEEQEALAELAAFSVIARWIDKCEVERAG